MADIGTIIKQKNAVRGNPKVAALTSGHDRREHTREVERNDRSAQRRANGDRFSDRTPFFDGTDHINLWDRGRTELGRALSMDSDLNIAVAGLGKFRSFYALWVYLTTKHRTMALSDAPAYKLRKMARDRKAADNFVEPENFRYVIMAALWDYVTKDKDLVDALIMSDEVPLVSYVEQDGARTLHSHAKWWLPMVKMVRATLIAGEMELDMSFLREAPGTYDQIVSTFRVSNSQVLGRIKRASVKEQPAPKPKVKKQRPESIAEAAPAAEEEGAKDTSERTKSILGYDRDDLNKSFAGIDGLGYRIIFIGDAQERKRVMFMALGRKMEDVLFDLRDEKKVPMGSHLNPEHYLKLFENGEGDVVGFATCDFPNPLAVGEDDGKVIERKCYDTDLLPLLADAANNRNAARAILISETAEGEENARYVLNVAEDAVGGYLWVAAPKPQRRRREKKPLNDGGFKPGETIFLGAPLSEEQALTGKHVPPQPADIDKWVAGINARRSQKGLSPVTVEQAVAMNTTGEITLDVQLSGAAEFMTRELPDGQMRDIVNLAKSHELVSEEASDERMALEVKPETPVTE